MYKAEKKYLQKEIHQNINSGDLSSRIRSDV